MWYTAPTAVRMMMQVRRRAVAAATISARYASLRAWASRSIPRRRVGPQEALGRPFHDNWWQTETGGIMIANYAVDGNQAGIDGQTAAGIEADASCASEATAPGNDRTARWPTGNLPSVPAGLRCSAAIWASPSAIANASQAAGISPGISRSAMPTDIIWFVGRADDVIKSAGHLVGPFEVESALMEHPAVAEAGVIGKPDPDGRRGDKGVRDAQGRASRRARRSVATCSAHARKRLGAVVAPKEIAFSPACPRRAGQDHASSAQGPRVGPAGRRHLRARKRRK